MAQVEYHPQGIQNLIYAFARSVSKDVVTLPPESAEVQQKVKELQQMFTRNFYTCTNEILSCLGEMYVDNTRFQRNIDQECGEGAAEFIRDAIRIYCKQ